MDSLSQSEQEILNYYQKRITEFKIETNSNPDLYKDSIFNTKAISIIAIPKYITNEPSSGKWFERGAILAIGIGVASGICDYLLINNANKGKYDESNYGLPLFGILVCSVVTAASIPASISLVFIGKSKNNRLKDYNKLRLELEKGNYPEN